MLAPFGEATEADFLDGVVLEFRKENLYENSSIDRSHSAPPVGFPELLIGDCSSMEFPSPEYADVGRPAAKPFEGSPRKRSQPSSDLAGEFGNTKYLPTYSASSPSCLVPSTSMAPAAGGYHVHKRVCLSAPPPSHSNQHILVEPLYQGDDSHHHFHHHAFNCDGDITTPPDKLFLDVSPTQATPSPGTPASPPPHLPPPAGCVTTPSATHSDDGPPHGTFEYAPPSPQRINETPPFQRQQRRQRRRRPVQFDHGGDGEEDHHQLHKDGHMVRHYFSSLTTTTTTTAAAAATTTPVSQPSPLYHYDGGGATTLATPPSTPLDDVEGVCCTPPTPPSSYPYASTIVLDSNMLCQTQAEVARQLGFSASKLSKLFNESSKGARWPYRKWKQLKTKVDKIEASGESARDEASLRELKRQMHLLVGTPITLNLKN